MPECGRDFPLAELSAVIAFDQQCDPTAVVDVASPAERFIAADQEAPCRSRALFFAFRNGYQRRISSHVELPASRARSCVRAPAHAHARSRPRRDPAPAGRLRQRCRRRPRQPPHRSVRRPRSPRPRQRRRQPPHYRCIRIGTGHGRKRGQRRHGCHRQKQFLHRRLLWVASIRNQETPRGEPGSGSSLLLGNSLRTIRPRAEVPPPPTTRCAAGG